VSWRLPVGDLDEHRRAIRVRWTLEKNDRYRHLALLDDLFAAIVSTLPAREDRELDPTEPQSTSARQRASGRAYGTDTFAEAGR
jgi:hypothetical protein